MHAAYALSQHWAQPTAQPAIHPRAMSAFPAPGRSTEGTACPGHVVCPGGALGGRPVAVVAVGCAAASFFFGAVYVAHAMPETCGGCGELMSCTQPELRVVKGRVESVGAPLASSTVFPVRWGTFFTTFTTPVRILKRRFFKRQTTDDRDLMTHKHLGREQDAGWCPHRLQLAQWRT